MAEVPGMYANLPESKPGVAVAATMDVVLAYSHKAGEVCEVQLSLPVSATVAMALHAVELSGVPGVCGIWGRVCAPETVLQAGDRVEWYRPLTVDPKVARRERFVSQGARGAGLFAKRRANSKAGY